jgi:hypothetical protein
MSKADQTGALWRSCSSNPSDRVKKQGQSRLRIQEFEMGEATCDEGFGPRSDSRRGVLEFLSRLSATSVPRRRFGLAVIGSNWAEGTSCDDVSTLSAPINDVFIVSMKKTMV